MYEQSRTSPVIMQNSNGPCPLVALVNTLILSTPPSSSTPLSRISIDRKEVTAEYLLELLADMLLCNDSGEQEDIAKVLSLLPSLHTGLNINPRFDGIFEESEELALFRSFNVDIVHGWVSDPENKYVHDALLKASSYEGAQSILVEAQELSTKKGAPSSLPAEEMKIVEYAGIINHFLMSTATQLTAAGLTFLSDLLSPGSLAVLFRNDHFSTIYKHHDSSQIFMLVTDQGYVAHKNVVWESLNDVSGFSSEFFTGTFVPISFAEQEEQERLESKRKKETGTIDGMTKDIRAINQGNFAHKDQDYTLAMEIQIRENERVAMELQRRFEREAAEVASRRQEARQANQTTAKAARVDSNAPSGSSRPSKASKASNSSGELHRRNTAAQSAGAKARGSTSRDKDKCSIM